MKAMILAAGRGDRLRPYTDTLPKPLVEVGGKGVIEHTLARLAGLGCADVVVNAWHLKEVLMSHVGDGSAYGTRVLWSPEETLLNTGGGVRNALPLLGEEPFMAVNGDIMWDLDVAPLTSGFDPSAMDAFLGLIPNPPEFGGDFALKEEGRLRRAIGEAGSLTYSGIQILNPAAVARYPNEPFSLNRLYDDAMAAGRLFGVELAGRWGDMGNPERLEKVRKMWSAPVAKRQRMG